MPRSSSSSYWHGNSGSAKIWKTGTGASWSWSVSGYGTQGPRCGPCARRRPMADLRPNEPCPTRSLCPTSPVASPWTGTPLLRQNPCGSTSTARRRKAPSPTHWEDRFTGPARSRTTSCGWCNSTERPVPAPVRPARRESPPSISLCNSARLERAQPLPPAP